MKYRKFGRTNCQVREIFFGVWQLGGAWGTIDEK